MSFRVVFTKSATKDIKKLDRVARKKIGLKIKSYSENPLRHSKRLIDKKLGNYRWRIGRLRIVFDIEDKTVIVLRVGDRKEIYRK